MTDQDEKAIVPKLPPFCRERPLFLGGGVRVGTARSITQATQWVHRSAQAPQAGLALWHTMACTLVACEVLPWGAQDRLWLSADALRMGSAELG